MEGLFFGRSLLGFEFIAATFGFNRLFWLRAVELPLEGLLGIVVGGCRATGLDGG